MLRVLRLLSAAAFFCIGQAFLEVIEVVIGESKDICGGAFIAAAFEGLFEKAIAFL